MAGIEAVYSFELVRSLKVVLNKGNSVPIGASRLFETAACFIEDNVLTKEDRVLNGDNGLIGDGVFLETSMCFCWRRRYVY